MMEPNRRFLVSQDWFFSQLFRELLLQFYSKAGADAPQETLNRFIVHDSRNNYREFNETKRNGET